MFSTFSSTFTGKWTSPSTGWAWFSKQILRALRGDRLSNGLGLCVNIELGKVKIWISSLGLTNNIIKAIHIRGFELLQKGIGVAVFMDRCLLSLTDLVLGIFYLFLIIL